MVNIFTQSELQKYINGFHDVTVANRLLTQRFKIKITASILDDKSKVWYYNYIPKSSIGDSVIENGASNMVLDEDSNIVSMSFNRIFDIDHEYAAEVDWTTARAEVLYDGVQARVFSHKGIHYVESDGNKNTEIAYSILQERFGKSPFSPFKKHNNGQDRYCWVFELVGPGISKVAPFEEKDLILVAAYDKFYGTEVIPRHVDGFASDCGFKRPYTYTKISSREDVDDLLLATHDLNKGFVIVDRRNRRVLIKNQTYRLVRKALESGNDISSYQLAKIVLAARDVEEIADNFPIFSDFLLNLQGVLEEELFGLDSMWSLYFDVDSRAEFADGVKEHPLSNILFAAYDGKIEDQTDATKLITPRYLVEELRKERKEYVEKEMGKIKTQLQKEQRNEES
jgi:hypothetical protein